IEVLPLKGPVLAETLYGDAMMRPCNDLDLLVRREDFQNAEVLLFDMGFVTRAAADDYHRRFLREGVMVELHYGVASPRSILFDVEGLWSRAGQRRFRSELMRVMSEEDLVLFLCHHGLKHGFSRLIWILDVAGALRRAWHRGPEVLMQSARRQGLERVLLIGCEIVRETFPQQLPEGIDTVIAESPMEAERAHQATEWLFAKSAGDSSEFEIFSFYLQTVGSGRQRWRHRLSFLAPTVEDYAWVDRHRIYRGLAPVLRPFRLLRKYGPSRMWKIMFPPQI
ncbi:MAG TPA: nucleotidyltransferase family protein, partial [Silvibacterium sp.]|nr:nucleotidyltransferase family protein [Silvibacterium sp.]